MSDILAIPEISLAPSLQITEKAISEKVELLKRAAVITAIPDDKTRDHAIKVSAEIKGQLKRVEAARVHAKKPFRRIAEEIDKLAKQYRARLDVDADRLDAMIGLYEETRLLALRADEETLEQQRTRLAEEALEEPPPTATQEELKTALERSVEAERRLDATGGQLAALRSDGAAGKATGGMLRKDWDIQVTDIQALYRAHPQCVELKPRLQAIKDLLRIGIFPEGIHVKETATFATRAAK